MEARLIGDGVGAVLRFMESVGVAAGKGGEAPFRALLVSRYPSVESLGISIPKLERVWDCTASIGFKREKNREPVPLVLNVGESVFSVKRLHSPFDEEPTFSAIVVFKEHRQFYFLATRPVGAMESPQATT